VRTFLPIWLLAFASISCSRSGVELQAGGKLSAPERQSIIAIHSEFTNWEPSQSATWIQHGVTRHVCIRALRIGSLTMPYWAIIFDDSGQVVEANIIQAPNPGTAESISGISPLRVAFRATDGKIYVCSGEYSQATWRQDVQRQMDSQKKLHEIVERWRRSGSTNLVEVDQMIQNALTNSPR